MIDTTTTGYRAMEAVTKALRSRAATGQPIIVETTKTDA